MKIPRPYQKDTIENIKKLLKSSTDPILVDASVGSGKSLICAEILLWIEKRGYKALCVTMNSTLINQNHQTYLEQGGNAGLYCAGLGEKNTDEPIIFGSPHSIVQGVKDGTPISKVKFNLIMVDECHSIDYHNKDSMLMKLLNWYGYQAQLNNYNFRIIGLSGTCYRGKGLSIVGENELFKTKACEISTSYLINQGFLVPPVFGLTNVKSFDYSKLRVNNMGKFNQSEVQAVIDKNERLTSEIMREVQSVVENGRNGAFIFAATRKHCEECARGLPDGQWAIITGETKHEERKIILESAKTGDIRYLISVNCLGVGVDVPLYDVCAWLRPTESLVLYTQGIGRVLRLHPGKESALILDYAGNLDRHGDIDNPIINHALQPTEENEQDFIIPCYTCATLNRVTARRCVGVHNNKRCEHYFDFKACHVCEVENDITARACRACQAELIDPNAKLSLDNQVEEVQIARAEYWVTAHNNAKSVYPILHARYFTFNNVNYVESYFTNSAKAKNVAYAKFIRPAAKNASDYYMGMQDYRLMESMMTKLRCPNAIVVKHLPDGKYTLIKKLFHAVE